MRYLWPALLAASFLGCNGGDVTVTPADLAMTPDLTPPTPTWTTTVVDVQTMKPIMGGQVCVAPANVICATTNAAGVAVLNPPLNAMFLLSYTFASYVPTFTEHTSTNVSASNTLPLISTSTQGILAGAVNQTVDQTKGNLVFSVVDDKGVTVAGVSFALTPTAGNGPYYFGSVGFPDKTATMTSSNGIGFVLNLPPADYDIKVTAAGKTCAGTPTQSWMGATASSAKGRAITASINTVAFVCR